MSNLKILLIDDEPQVLRAYERTLKDHFLIEVAEGPRAGLTKILSGSHYAVVVTDLEMPGFSGLEILRRLRELSPDTVGILISDNYRPEAALSLLNDGVAYRFLSKQCSVEQLSRAIEDSKQYYRLLSCQNQYQRDTLEPLAQMMSVQLYSMERELFGHAFPLSRFVRELALGLKLPKPGDFEMAAALVSLGWCSSPLAVQKKLRGNLPCDSTVGLTLGEHEAHLCNGLARLARIGELVEMLHEPDLPWAKLMPVESLLATPRVKVGGHLLHLAREFAQTALRTHSESAALMRVRARTDHYHPKVIEVVESIVHGSFFSQPLRLESLIS
jgi:DNA-binding NarL/FixJ family response regulator